MSVATRCSAVCYFNVKNSGASLYFGRPSQGRLVYGLASTPGGRGGPNFSIFICEISAGERGGWVVARTGFGINSGGSVGGKGEGRGEILGGSLFGEVWKGVAWISGGEDVLVGDHGRGGGGAVVQPGSHGEESLGVVDRRASRRGMNS